MVIGDHILLVGFKMGDKFLDQSGLEDIFIGHLADGDFILDDSNEL